MTENRIAPSGVHSVTVFNRDVVTHRRSRVVIPHRTKLKGEVCGKYSAETARKLGFLANNSGEAWTAIILLTYPKVFPTDGDVVRRHLGRYLDALRRKCPGIRYIWVREYQDRGAPHFHILVNWPVGEVVKRWRPSQGKYVRIDKRLDEWACAAWASAVGHECRIPQTGLVVSWEVLEKADGGARYLAEYASKMAQKVIPPEVTNSGRWWMPSRGVKARPLAKFRASDAMVADVMEGREVSRTGDTFRVLHGAAERWIEAMWAGMAEREERDARVVRIRHRKGCGCHRCEPFPPQMEEQGDAAAMFAAMRCAESSLAMWLKWWASMGPLARCAETVRRSGWQAVGRNGDGSVVLWMGRE